MTAVKGYTIGEVIRYHGVTVAVVEIRGPTVYLRFDHENISRVRRRHKAKKNLDKRRKRVIITMEKKT